MTPGQDKTQNIEADFSMDPSEGPAPLTVQFFSKSFSVSTIFSYFWDFGDGNESYDRDPVHTYYLPGKYDVVLIIDNTEGNSDSHTRTVTVTPNDYTPPNTTTDPPISDFTVDTDEGSPPLTVKFTDRSYDLNGEIISWEWDFGDGYSSTDQNPSHTYDEVGDYTATLTVFDNDYLTNSSVKTIKVIIGSVETTVILTSDDAFISSQNPDANFGERTYLQASGQDIIYLKFKDLPEADSITEARLMLYTTYPLHDGPELVAYATSDTSWSGNEVTWNDGISFSTGVIDRTLVNGSQAWFTWDVTTAVIEFATSGAITLGLTGATSQVARFFSLESDSIYTAKLELDI